MPGALTLLHNPSDRDSPDCLNGAPRDVWHHLFTLCFDQDQEDGVLNLMFTCRYLHEIGVKFLYSQVNMFPSQHGTLLQYNNSKSLNVSDYLLKHRDVMRDVKLLCALEPFLPRFSFVSTLPFLRSLTLVRLKITEDVHSLLLDIPIFSSICFRRCSIGPGSKLSEMPVRTHAGLQCLEIYRMIVRTQIPFATGARDIALQEYLPFWSAWLGPSLQAIDFEEPIIFGYGRKRNAQFGYLDSLEPLFAVMPTTIMHMRFTKAI
ncbi:hypothetical protein DACRYDRAFT_115087 [Dacryopinax primogenitus]|uniref:F-box domain-containing protein n=1 Tax=Dacryopinax primogenitus (strain DJM 731) TaxID=1858805 RepID=M5GF18_DACPD|nr:uncharacterized protein DACRYDRAFT_115087 [Dacryopinax primogenitus]EJU03753.1 hypothetical protein DACRYDRAFT_115087 [Dacryopinax primogenitus]